MAVKTLKLDQFSAGISDSNKQGLPGAVNFNRSLDIYTEPTEVSLLPKTAKISASTVTDLIKWFSVGGDGNVYGYGDTGKLYQNNAGSISVITTASDSHGNGLAYFDEDDYLYYATDTVIDRYGPLSNSPAESVDHFSDGTYDADDGSSASADETGQTYTLTTAVNEGATHKRSFIPTKDPQKSFEVNISGKGTGNWTLTIHDENNDPVTSATIANASLAASGDQKFTFATAWRPILGRTYHAHLHSSVADGTVVTGTASDFADADFHTYFQILVDDSDYHPIIDFAESLLFGNSNYIGLWDGFTFPINPNRIKLPAGYKVRSLVKIGEYVAAGCWKGSSITANETGLIIFWDGVSTDFNFSITVSEGGINAMATNQDRLFFVAGSQGQLFTYLDGIQKVINHPKITPQTYVEIAPGAMNNWQSLLLLGSAINSDSTTIEKGVYTWGQKNKGYAEALSYGFPISTGTRTGATLKIGAALGQGQTLHIGWRDDSTYGWDTVSNSSDPFASGVLETLIFDDNSPYHEKQAHVIRVDHEALASGESVTIAYKINRATSWTSGTANSTVGSTETRLNINDRFKEIELQITVATSGSTSPLIYCIAFNFDDLDVENKV